MLKYVKLHLLFHQFIFRPGENHGLSDWKNNTFSKNMQMEEPYLFKEYANGRKIPGHGGDVQLRDDGRLADIAPTILEILQIPVPCVQRNASFPLALML